MMVQFSRYINILFLLSSAINQSIVFLPFVVGMSPIRSILVHDKVRNLVLVLNTLLGQCLIGHQCPIVVMLEINDQVVGL